MGLDVFTVGDMNDRASNTYKKVMRADWALRRIWARNSFCLTEKYAEGLTNVPVAVVQYGSPKGNNYLNSQIQARVLEGYF